MAKEIVDMLKALIAEKLNVDISDVIPEAEFESDLGADSLAMMELSLSVEDLFDNDFDIEEEERSEIVTVQTLIDLIAEKIK